MGDIPSLRAEVACKKKNVNVLLIFSEEKNDAGVRSFYDGLKKLYMEEMNSGRTFIGREKYGD